MNDKDKAKDQLIKDLAEMRQQAEALKRPETGRKWAEEEIKEGERRYGELADLLPQKVFGCAYVVRCL